MLLILVLALLFCPSLAEEELRGVKHKYADSGRVTYYLYVIKKRLPDKIKSKAIPFRQKTIPKFNSFASAIPIVIFLPPEVKERSFPFGPVVGEEGFEPPTPWFVATCSNPLSYRPHPVSTGSVPGSTLKKEPLLSRFVSD